MLIDVGPNLGAISRSALIAAKYVVTPLGADLFSIQGLKNLGPSLKAWRREWRDRLERNPVAELELPEGQMNPLAYVVMQPNLYGDTVTKAYQRWLCEVPAVYAAKVLGRELPEGTTIDTDACALGILRHYRSLMPMAQGEPGRNMR